MAYEDDIRQLYQQQMGRDADAAGLSYYANLLQSGGSVNDIVNMMQASPEKQGPDFRTGINSAFTSEGMTPYFSDTTTPITPWGGYTGSSTANLTGPTGPVNSYNQMVNPAYASTLGPGPTNTTANASNMTPSVLPDPFRTSYASGGNLGMGSNTGSASPQLGSYTANPYLGQMSDDITRRTGLARDQALQGVRSNAIGLGGLGGSRQGVAEAGVINQSLDNLTGQLANLNFQDYTGQQNRNLQQYGMDQGFYTSQRGQDLAQIGLGSQLETQALQNQWYPITQAANIYGSLGGLNSSTTNTASQGGGAMGALGGMLGTAQIGSNLKWW